MLPPRAARSAALTVLIPILLPLAGCVGGLRPENPAPPPPVEPLNLSDAKAAALAYVDSGAYTRDFAAAAAKARAWIEQRSATRKPGERLAVVLDIDETALSNLPHMRAEDFGYHARGWRDWIDSARAPALEPMLDLFRQARACGVSVLFLTGREAPRDRAGTEENLRRAGFADHAALRFCETRDRALPTSAARKTAARAAWEAEGWTLIATIGDQESDLVGGHAERAFKLPNPFYRTP